jgi:Fe-S cluster assembly protein SufD
MNQKYVIKKSEEFFLPVIWMGQEKVLDYQVILGKEDSQVKLLMLVLGAGDKSVDININIIHEKPRTKSQVIVRGILSDSSRVNFNGLVKINQGSELSNAWLAAHLLLVSDMAQGRAVPSLEILENDVKAGHATTVGKINDSEVFYLMSRGISRSRAKQIIINGFISGLLNDFPDTPEKSLALKKIKNVI